MSIASRRDAAMLGVMLAVLLFLFGLLVNEAVNGNWFTAIVLGIPIVPSILGVGGLFVHALGQVSGKTRPPEEGTRPPP